MNLIESIGDLVPTIVFLFTLGYLALCAIAPYKACRHCNGAGKVFGPFHSVWFCRACDATGARLRFGRVVWNRIYRLYRDIKNYRHRR